MAPSREEFERRHDAIVREEIETFRRKAAAFLAGEIPEDDFKPYRLKHGIYGQRQAGVQMVRCRIPGGLLTARQMERLAAIAGGFAGGRGHLTTRQNLQFHFVPLARVAEVMHLLADVGLTNREACYNTVRNVTVCPLAGLARGEVFDVRPYARKLGFALLRKKLTGNLPRKFKIAFDGCPGGDCASGGINDLGVYAVLRDGRRGFRLVVGGGLGPLPMEAAPLDEFVPAENLLPRTEALIRVFDRYGNRANRNLARLKFILRDRGIAWLKEQVDAEYKRVLREGGEPWPEMVPEGFGGFESNPRALGSGAGLPEPSPDGACEDWRTRNVIPQQQDGFATVAVRVDQGNLTSRQMRGLASLAAGAGDGLVRLGIDQNAYLAFIPCAVLPRVHAALAAIDLAGPGAREICDAVTCPGAYSCNLALTKTMELGKALAKALEDYTDPQVRRLRIRAGGCPNACGHHWLGDFGFYGNARKIDGREAPYYQMLLGGPFGQPVQSIPARRVPQAVRAVLDHFLAARLPGENFRAYVRRHGIEFFRELTAPLANPVGAGPEVFQDWGDEAAFSLELGRGECAV